MPLKRIVNLVLLVFVAITIATFVYKEYRNQNESRTHKSATIANSSYFEKNDSESKSIQSVPKEKATNAMAEVSKTEKIPSKEEIIDKKKYEANRNFDKKAPATAVDSLPTNEATVLTNNEAPKNEENMNEAKPSEKVIVYYFITTTRCPSCYKIENYTHSCILDKFPNELNSGKMEWKVVNVDEKENAHFIKEYELFTKSVVLSKQVDGKEVKWIKLEKVWDLLGDQKEFYNYIESETRKFIGEIK